MLDIENFDNKFKSIVQTNEFKELQTVYNKCKHIFMFGHGGNMGIADHAAIDASRLTDKNIIAPLENEWGYIRTEKVGRNRWIHLTDEGRWASEFLI